MRSNFEFRSADLDDGARADELPRGEAVARLIAERLADFDFVVKEVGDEDWGWYINIVNDAFPLWIGCGGYSEFDDGHLCFIEPKKPVVRRWFRKVPTEATIERLATAIEMIVSDSGQASHMRWRTEEENIQR